MGSTAPSGQKLPAGQGPLHVDVVKPAAVPKVPAGHAFRRPPAQYVPGSHRDCPDLWKRVSGDNKNHTQEYLASRQKRVAVGVYRYRRYVRQR